MSGTPHSDRRNPDRIFRLALAFLVVALSIAGGVLRLRGLGGGVWPFASPQQRDSRASSWIRGENQWQGFHPDEVRIWMALQELSLKEPRKWDPKFFAYGSLPLYAYKALHTVWMDRLAAAETSKTGVDVEVSPRIRGYHELGYISGRLITCLLGTLTLPLVFFMGRSWFGWREGLIAAALLCFCAFHIQASHFLAVDVILQFLMCGCLFFCGLILKTGKLRYYPLAGLFLGASLASKFNAVYLFPVLGCVHLVSLWKSKEHFQLKSWKRWAMGALACLLAMGVFRLGMPYAFLGSREQVPPRLAAKMEKSAMIRMATQTFNPQFLWHIMEENEKARNLNRRPVPYMIQYERTPAFLYQIRNWCGVAMGPMLGWSGILGCLLLLLDRKLRRNPMTWFFWSWILIYFGSTGSFHAKFLRHSLPLYCHLCLGSGVLLVWISDRVRSKELWAKGHFCVTPLVVGVVFLPTVWYGFAFLSIFSRPHTRIAARDWMSQVLDPQDTRLILETKGWDPLTLPPAFAGEKPDKKRYLELYGDDNERKVNQMVDALAWGNWLIIGTKRQMGSLTRVPERYPFTTSFYQLLYSGMLGYEMAACFRSYPSFLGWTFRDDLGDESFAVYDHPKVLLFTKMQDLTEEEIRSLLEDTPGEVLALKIEELLLAPSLDWSASEDLARQVRTRPITTRATSTQPAKASVESHRDPVSLFKGGQGPWPGWLNEARDLAVSPAGEIYVADFRNHRVQVFGLDGTFQRQWGKGGVGSGQFQDLSGIMVHSSGQIYVTDTFNHRVQWFDAEGKYQGMFQVPERESFFAPTGIAEGAQGLIYVVNTGNRFVYRFDPQGAFQLRWGGEGKGPGQFNHPVGCAVDGKGRILVADCLNFRIQWFDQDGAFLKERLVPCWRGEGHLEAYLDVDPQGRIWTTDSRNGLVLCLDSEGKVLRSLGQGELVMPTGIALTDTEVLVLDSRKHKGYRFPLQED